MLVPLSKEDFSPEAVRLLLLNSSADGNRRTRRVSCCLCQQHFLSYQNYCVCTWATPWGRSVSLLIIITLAIKRRSTQSVAWTWQTVPLKVQRATFGLISRLYRMKAEHTVQSYIRRVYSTVVLHCTVHYSHSHLFFSTHPAPSLLPSGTILFLRKPGVNNPHRRAEPQAEGARGIQVSVCRPP